MQQRFNANDSQAATVAAAVLARGGIVLYPTDTAYGLGVDARNPEALQRLFTLKGRPETKPVSVQVDNLNTAATTANLSPIAMRLAEKFLPGALTIVATLHPQSPLRITSPHTTVGIRIIDHAFCRHLTATTNFPITATSANRSGAPTLSSVPEILEQLGQNALMIDLVIDGGHALGQTPSTVVDTTTSPPTLLRPGAIAWEQILVEVSPA